MTDVELDESFENARELSILEMVGGRRTLEMLDEGLVALAAGAVGWTPPPARPEHAALIRMGERVTEARAGWLSPGILEVSFSGGLGVYAIDPRAASFQAMLDEGAIATGDWLADEYLALDRRRAAVVGAVVAVAGRRGWRVDDWATRMHGDATAISFGGERSEFDLPIGASLTALLRRGTPASALRAVLHDRPELRDACIAALDAPGSLADLPRGPLPPPEPPIAMSVLPLTRALIAELDAFAVEVDAAEARRAETNAEADRIANAAWAAEDAAEAAAHARDAVGSDEDVGADEPASDAVVDVTPSPDPVAVFAGEFCATTSDREAMALTSDPVEQHRAALRWARTEHRWAPVHLTYWLRLALAHGWTDVAAALEANPYLLPVLLTSRPRLGYWLMGEPGALYAEELLLAWAELAPGPYLAALIATIAKTDLAAALTRTHGPNEHYATMVERIRPTLARVWRRCRPLLP